MADSFTVFSTFILALVVIVSAYLVFYTLKKLKFKIDKNFLFALFPGLFLIVFIRVFEDAGIYPTSFFTQSPGIELLLIFMIIPTFLIAKLLERWKKINPNHSIAVILGVPALLHLPFLLFVNVTPFILIFSLFSAFTALATIARHYLKFDLLSLWAIVAHFLDASATFVSLTYFGYYEQHVLPSFLINTLGGAWVMFPLKALVVIPSVYIINKYSDDKALRNFILICVTILGLAPGLRDAFRLLMGV